MNSPSRAQQTPTETETLVALSVLCGEQVQVLPEHLEYFQTSEKNRADSGQVELTYQLALKNTVHLQ
ncbi:hypothetical protein [Agaribacterium haliotis]|uniref:hypothetical protein n=1 Tax=Agaribacterium haliotis TaxID=2013869 RepID=UPI00117886BB|nr:hypothetical protein [Agaribacterium haliotis]